MRTAVAIFDLDNTLLHGDSDYLWGRFVAERGLVDATAHARENARFYADYATGQLDIHAWLRFQLAPLARYSLAELDAWREIFLKECILPLVLPAALELIQAHRCRGDRLVIATSTNAFITRPIAAHCGVPELIATEPEIRNGRYTGDTVGLACFREGKLARVRDWLTAQSLALENCWFYSDSHNDLPLLQAVGYPVAVDPDERLRSRAHAKGWSIVSLRQPAGDNGAGAITA